MATHRSSPRCRKTTQQEKFTKKVHFNIVCNCLKKKKENSLNVLSRGGGGRKGKSGTTFIQQQPINTVLVLLLYTTILHDTVLYTTPDHTIWQLNELELHMSTWQIIEQNISISKEMLTL